MARKSAIAKQKRRQKMVNEKWSKRQNLKKVIIDPTKSDEERHEAMMKLNKMPKNSSKVRLRNRCLVTGRCRGYMSKFQLSRLCFREFALSGYIPGMTKASW
ncbi:MAG: 30S ribosomal protein S14 [Chlamydiota bacterium]